MPKVFRSRPYNNNNRQYENSSFVHWVKISDIESRWHEETISIKVVQSGSLKVLIQDRNETAVQSFIVFFLLR